MRRFILSLGLIASLSSCATFGKAHKEVNVAANLTRDFICKHQTFLLAMADANGDKILSNTINGLCKDYVAPVGG